MRPAALGRLIWVLIYGGLLMLAVGGYMARAQSVYGIYVLIVGGVSAAVGALLIVVRSRMRDDDEGRA